MNMKTQKKLALIYGVPIALIWLVVEEWGESFTETAISMALFLFLLWVIPARFERNCAVFFVMVFCIGVPAGMVVDNFVEIPAWLAWAWLGFSLVVSVFFPFRNFRFFRKYSPDSFH